MEQKEFENILTRYLKEINIQLDKEQVLQFYQYMQLLIEWNKKMNLTAIIEPHEIILKHFVDSLTMETYLQEGATLVDVGTGAGFPGIPLKICRKDIKIVLVDSLNKRLNFLNEVIQKLKLDKIETVHSRAEELGRNKEYREKFDIATSRAVANLATLSEYLIPFVKKEGKCICMKGSNVEEELENSKKAIQILGGKIIKMDSFFLPQTEIKRNIIVIKKIERTPVKYPRKPGLPAKEPIL